MAEEPRRKLKIPSFASEREAAGWFDRHSAELYWEDLEPSRRMKLSPELQKRILENYTRRKSAISIRLEPQQVAAARRIAARRSIGYQTQLRIWIAEGIERDARKAAR